MAAPVRSLALSFSSDSGQRWRTPEEFYQQIQVLTPDPITGKPDGEKIQAFFAAHPETAAFNQWK